MDSRSQGMHVADRPAAEGLARQAIRDWHDSAVRGKARLLEMVGRGCAASKGAARIKRDLRSVLDPLAFHSVVLPINNRELVLAWMSPSLREMNRMEHLAVALDVYYVGRRGVLSTDARVLMFIHPDVLTRMFLRLQTTDLAEVRREIEPTLILYAALADACAALELRQIVIPTARGHFHCDVRPDVAFPCAIVARAWIDGDAIERHEEVIESVLTAMEKWKGPTCRKDRVRLKVPMSGPEGLTLSLVEELAAHAWLAEPYEERGDDWVTER